MALNGPLKLHDEDFWGDYRKTEQEVRASMEERNFQGLLIDAPERVALDRRDSAPVLGWWVRTLREDVDLDAIRRTLVAAVDLETNALRVGLALDRGKTPAPRTPPSGFDPGEGLALSMFDFDLQQALDVPKREGRYRVTVLLRERMSNSVTVALVRTTAGYRDEEVEAFLENRRKHRVEPPPSRVFPAKTRGPIPSYMREAGTPAMPVSMGIALLLEEEREDGVDILRILRGSFRLPVLRRERVQPDWHTEKLPDVGDPKATAIVPIHLVITGSKVAGPWVARLDVPVYDPIDPEAPGALAAGYFSVDLYDLPTVPERPDTYYLYALCGEASVGPVKMAIR